MKRVPDFVRRALRAVKIVVRDDRIPRPIRWGGALALLPLPGPFDEAALLLVGCVLWLFYREQISDAWSESAAAAESVVPSDPCANLPSRAPS